MIFQALHALYDRLAADPGYNIVPPGFSLQKITFKVVLTLQGECVGIYDARQPVDGQLQPRRARVLGTTKPSGSGLNPCFLWDNSAYLLGFKVDDDTPDRTRLAFAKFRETHLEREGSINASAYSAVCRFLESWDPANAALYPELAEAAQTGFGVFQIQARPAFVHEDPEIVAWWTRRLERKGDETRGQCLITGIDAPIARLHPKICGVRGALGPGVTIAGFNEPAYESYGKKQSYNAPVAEGAAFRYTSALTALLDSPMRDKHRLFLGDATVVFWTERPTVIEDVFAQWAAGRTRTSDLVTARQPVQDEDLRHKVEIFLRALRRGRSTDDDLEQELGRSPDEIRYFLLGISPNKARLSVRFFHRGTLGELLRNLRLHFQHIGVAPQPESEKRRADPEMPSMQQLLDQSCPIKNRKPDRKKIPPILSGQLLDSVVKGTRYPDGLFNAVLRRIKANDPINYLRVCVIKGYLVRNRRQEVSMSLDETRKEPAYRLGRLFAALEKTQREAHDGKLNKTIRDSFYGSASANPRSVFPRLLRTYQHHLAKLEGGQKVNREKLVQEIFDSVEDWPAHLGLADQGLFAIGYYHQTRAFYTTKQAPSENPV